MTFLSLLCSAQTSIEVPGLRITERIPGAFLFIGILAMCWLVYFIRTAIFTKRVITGQAEINRRPREESERKDGAR